MSELKKPIHIEIEQQEDVCVVRCKGRLIAAADTEYVRSRMEDIKRVTCAKVLVDVRDVPAIGSLGIGFLVSIYTSLTGKSGRFVLVGAVPFVREVLDVTRLSTVIPMAPDLAAGLARLRD
jgi:stage II sporulation protein AA (anti-sigma F factor antagonist)